MEHILLHVAGASMARVLSSVPRSFQVADRSVTSLGFRNCIETCFLRVSAGSVATLPREQAMESIGEHENQGSCSARAKSGNNFLLSRFASLDPLPHTTTLMGHFVTAYDKSDDVDQIFRNRLGLYIRHVHSLQ